MATPTPRPSYPSRFIGALAPLLLLSLPTAVSAQTTGYGQPLGLSSQDRQMFGNGSGGGSASPIGGGSAGLDISNPIDLINRLRRSSAMDDATPPASAVDQALKELEAPSAKPPAAGASSAAGRTPPAAGAGSTTAAPAGPPARTMASP